MLISMTPEELNGWTSLIAAVGSVVAALGVAIATVISAFGKKRIESVIRQQTAQQTAEIKLDVKKVNEKIDEKSHEITQKTEEVKTLVNGPLERALHEKAQIATELADVTGRELDMDRAKVAQSIADNHSRGIKRE